MSSQTHAQEMARNQAGSLRDTLRTTFEQRFGGGGAVEGEKESRKVSCGHLGLRIRARPSSNFSGTAPMGGTGGVLMNRLCTIPRRKGKMAS